MNNYYFSIHGEGFNKENVFVRANDIVDALRYAADEIINRLSSDRHDKVISFSMVKEQKDDRLVNDHTV